MQVDTRTRRVVGDALPLGASPASIAVTSRDVWIADTEDATLTRVIYRP